jgi:hypothetical protein
MDSVFVVAHNMKPRDTALIRKWCLHSGVRPVIVNLMDWKDKVETLPEGSYALVLGAEALGSVLPVRVALSDVRGRWWKLSTGQWAMASYHPGVVSHGYSPKQEALLQQDIEKFMASVVFEDLVKPTVSDHCVRCTRYATYFINKLGFCQEHTPRQRRTKTWTQIALDI